MEPRVTLCGVSARHHCPNSKTTTPPKTLRRCRRTTKLFDRMNCETTLDKVRRIAAHWLILGNSSIIYR
jgi:hypothetical protein